MLRGPGIAFQINESLFAHKKKHDSGRFPDDDERWVFGMVDTSLSPSTGYMEVVDRHYAVTLLLIIQQHVTVLEASFIQWWAYAGISQQLGFQRDTVNHSLHFVNPLTGVHTHQPSRAIG